MSHSNHGADNGWADAVAHLSTDPELARLIARVGPCRLRPRKDYYMALCQAIFAQQVSTVVATIIFKRFRKLFPGSRPTPARTLKLTDRQLQSAGVSRQKRGYLRDLARHFASGKVPVRRLCRMSDQQIMEVLLPVKGVGRWTVEMFLIFVMNRPDVWPVDDLGVKKSVQALRKLKALPDAKSLGPVADAWRPWRTVAAWYLWRGLE